MVRTKPTQATEGYAVRRKVALSWLDKDKLRPAGKINLVVTNHDGKVVEVGALSLNVFRML